MVRENYGLSHGNIFLITGELHKATGSRYHFYFNCVLLLCMCILAVLHLFQGRLIVEHDFAPRDNVRPASLRPNGMLALTYSRCHKKVRISVLSAEQPVPFCFRFPPVYFVICPIPLCHACFFASFSATFHVLHDESSTSVDQCFEGEKDTVTR